MHIFEKKLGKLRNFSLSSVHVVYGCSINMMRQAQWHMKPIYSFHFKNQRRELFCRFEVLLIFSKVFRYIKISIPLLISKSVNINKKQKYTRPKKHRWFRHRLDRISSCCTKMYSYLFQILDLFGWKLTSERVSHNSWLKFIDGSLNN